MTKQNILQALKDRKINPEQATHLLRELKQAETLTARPVERSAGGEGIFTREKIAIIGMAGQFPKAPDLDRYWQNLAAGVDCISEMQFSRWPLDEFWDADPRVPGKTNGKWMGLLEDVDMFDPLFFNLSPLEAEQMDPQQRLFLENCWHCLEDAGIKPSSLSNSRCGVFVGCSSSDYRDLYETGEMNAYTLLGMHLSILSARISYLLNLKGPTLSIDTACSSSLVAIAEACNSLLLHDSDLALTGGVCMLAGPSIHIMTSKMDVLSPDGRCYTFDERANGYVPGEGVGVLLLKRLADAERDGDRICGIISGWGVNQDGKTNGITAPSSQSQSQLLSDIYRKFAIDPAYISMVEAHGTATQMGDPIEVAALIKAFGQFTQKTNYCALGSVKSNIGHLMNASGVAGVLKILLSIKNRAVPPSINFTKLNPHIALEGSPFFVNDSLRPWTVASGVPRRAAVSSFSFSGTNAHIVIEEYLAETPAPLNRPTVGDKLFVLSAKTDEARLALANRFLVYIKEHPDVDLGDLAYTLQTGREELKYRLAIVCNTSDGLVKELTAMVTGQTSEICKLANIRSSSEEAELFNSRTEMRTLREKLLEARAWPALAALWLKGIEIDWTKLYPARASHRLALPLYPFAKERYWLSKATHVATPAQNPEQSFLHPLVHRNTSSFLEQRFTSNFSGREFFLQDHQVQSRKILPGSVYLEMARVAAELAMEMAGTPKIAILRNVVWVAPFYIDDTARSIHTVVEMDDQGSILFEIYSGHDEAVPIVHSQGSIEFLQAEDPQYYDQTALLKQTWTTRWDSAQCYAYFDSLGIQYGPAHQRISALEIGAGLVRATLTWSDFLIADQSAYLLHPAMLDAAFQACCGFLGMHANSATLVPFSIDQIEVFAALSGNPQVIVTSKGNTGVYQQFDVTICAEDGRICSKVSGLTLRNLLQTAQEPANALAV